MTPTGLPPLPTTHNTRAWTLWLNAAIERVRREAMVEAMDGAQQRGRVEGAERVKEWLLSSLPPESVAE